MNLVKLLANNWQPIAIIALVGTGLAVSHHQGYKSAFAKQQAVIDKMERDKAQALLLSAQNYARELELARAEAKKYEVKAHAVGMALAKKQAEVSRLKTETCCIDGRAGTPESAERRQDGHAVGTRR
ncbi:hypothetical protein [Neisseria meningitidis]|uniref:hypothetical protein n=1 Tax=Neisseria meningitidis TaxID=487 RepID=UPI001F3B843E|nr:hypothetical protein [Neisseria meningitidis]